MSCRLSPTSCATHTLHQVKTQHCHHRSPLSSCVIMLSSILILSSIVLLSSFYHYFVNHQFHRHHPVLITHLVIITNFVIINHSVIITDPVISTNPVVIPGAPAALFAPWPPTWVKPANTEPPPLLCYKSRVRASTTCRTSRRRATASARS